MTWGLFFAFLGVYALGFFTLPVLIGVAVWRAR